MSGLLPPHDNAPSAPPAAHEPSAPAVVPFRPAASRPTAGSANAGVAGMHAYGATVLPADQGYALDYLRIIHKRRWPALAGFLIVSLAVIVYTFTATPLYDARTQVLIESDDQNVVSFQEVIEKEKGTNDYYQTQFKILQSRSLARRVMDRLDLWKHPRFAAQETPGAVATLATTVWANVTGLFGSEAPVDPPAADETAAQSKALDAFLEGLTVAPVRNSRLVDVRYRSPQAHVSANVANALANAYIEQSLEFKFTASKEASDWLGEQLADQRKKVEESEQALQRYREQNDSLALEDRENIVVQKLGDINSAVTKAKTERIQKEALYRQVSAIEQDRSAMDTMPAILLNSFIQELKGELAGLQRQEAQLSDQLGAKHPDMIKVQTAIGAAELKLKAEVAKVVASIRNDYEAAVAQERSLVGALDAQKGEALALNRKGIEYGVLRRDAESNRQIYDTLLQRAKETGVSAELRTSNIRIVDPAEVPQTPASPRRGLNLVMALLGGLFVGVGIAFGFESLDNRIRQPEELKDQLGLPFLGMIPVLRDGDPSRHRLITQRVPPAFSEAFRAIRTNVLFSSADEGTRSVVVTSTRPGEGKSMVASNLAIAIAQAGHRVLLIDTDMRRPRVHDIFAQPMEPGLSNLLVGQARLSDVVRVTTVPGLAVVTAGTLPPNPAELLASRRFRDLLRSFAEKIDWVVFDAPPVMAVTDASITANLASGVVFVVGSEMTARQAARAALEQLAASRATLIGAVLNRVDVERNSYYYSHYYRKEYSTYYRAVNG